MLGFSEVSVSSRNSRAVCEKVRDHVRLHGEVSVSLRNSRAVCVRK